MTGHDLRQFFDGFFQLARGVTAVAVGVQPHKGQHAQAYLVAVDFCALAGDEARLLQRPPAAPGVRTRQAHARLAAGIGQTTLAFPLLEACDVD